MPNDMEKVTALQPNQSLGKTLDARPAWTLSLEKIEKLRRRQHGNVAREPEKVLVVGDEGSAPTVRYGMR
jgi:hypothetical protein